MRHVEIDVQVGNITMTLDNCSFNVSNIVSKEVYDKVFVFSNDIRFPCRINLRRVK